MALPAAFSSSLEYFSAAIDFLQRNAWIYQHANTRFIRAGVLERAPPDFREFFSNVDIEDLNAFPFVHEELGLDARLKSEALRSFRTELRRLIPNPIDCQPTHGVEASMIVGTKRNSLKVSPKKQHEIMQLTHCINTICQPMTLLLDFGAGLGYLNALLHTLNPKWRILGLEAKELCVAAAQKRLHQQMPEAASGIVYRQHFINANASDLEQQVRLSGLWPPGEPPHDWAIVGLHACADLSVTAIKLFLDMNAVRKLVIMPCCYHKLKLTHTSADAAGVIFDNFPLSAALKSAVADVDYGSFLNIPFLRLACQETHARWRECTVEEHADHGRQMYWRALVDAIICDETEMPIALAKVQRHVDPQSSEVSFDGMRRRFELRAKARDGKNTRRPTAAVAWNDRHEQKFNEVVACCGDMGEKFAEGLTCLQMTMQRLCENILLYDWLCYMEESAAAKHDLKIKVRFQKILNEKLSPRCNVLIAEKL